MKTRLLFLAIVMLTFLVPTASLAQQWFDYDGMALLPAAAGQTVTMYGLVRDGSPATETPIPLDFANYEYTLVISDLMWDTDAFPDLYSNGTITIYEDAPGADFTAPGTFTDGQIVLSGIVNTLSIYHYSDVGPMTNGSGTGTVDWTGGLNLNDIAPDDQTGWTFVTATNSRSDLVEDGYSESWTGKVEPEIPIVDIEKISWDGLKAMF
jgi:hypothetical protein